MWKLIGLLGIPVSVLEKVFLPKSPSLSPEERKRRQSVFRGHTLYHFQLSPPSANVRRKVSMLGIHLPMVDVLNHAAAYQELVTNGGKDQVPCLKIEEPGNLTRWMYESKDIIQYLDQRAN